MSGRGDARGAYSRQRLSGTRHGNTAALSSAYASLAAELTRTEIRAVGGYTLGRVIGKGSFGTVRIGVHRLTNTRVAIKQVPKSLPFSGTDPSSPLALLTREIHHHRRLRHPHLLALYEIIATESSIYLVTELCTGGELFDYLVEKGRLSVPETRRIFGQLVLGVAHLHQLGVVHRDLKLENVLLDERVRVKIADLGFGREFEQGRWMETRVGTLGYCAPEVLSGKRYLGEAVDIWSLGVILYTLLTGSLPFDDDDDGIMKARILRCDYEIPAWLDHDSTDLITGILRLDPLTRFSLKAILAHPFFTRPLSQVVFYDAHRRAPSPHFGLDDHPAPIPEESDSPFQERPAFLDDSSSGVSLPVLSTPRRGASPGRSSAASKSDGNRGRSPAVSPPTSPSEDGAMQETVRQGKRREVVPDVLTVFHRNGSQSTIRRSEDGDALRPSSGYPALSSNKEDEPLPRAPSPPHFLGLLAPTLQRNVSASSSSSTWSHPRTPSRTKRRSVGSMMSERLLPFGEDGPSATIDYLSMLAHPVAESFAVPAEKGLLTSLTHLGFDTGQIMHSVTTNACDSSGAVWWMLRCKLDADETTKADEPPAPSTTVLDVAAAQEIAPRAPEPIVALSAPVAPVLLAPVAVVVSTSHLRPRAQTLVSRSPPGSPASIQPPSDATPEIVSKPRSNSVSMLARATTAIGNTLALKKEPKEDGAAPLARLFGRKLSDHSSSDLPLRLSAPPSPSQSNKDRDLQSSPPRPSSSPTSSPRASPSLAAAVRDTPSPLFSYGLSPVESPSAAPSSSTNKKGSKSNLFTNFRMWLGDDRKKRKRAVSTHTDSSLPTRDSPAVRRAQRPDLSYVNSPLKRPPIGSRRSSTGSAIQSRRSSTTSIQHGKLVDLAGKPRVRSHSDASRASMSDHSRPPSLHSFLQTDLGRRPPPSAAGSASSVGSRRSHSTTALVPPPFYRRSPSATTVRRIHPPRHLRTRSSASIPTRHSSSSSVAGEDTKDDDAVEERIEEPAILEEDESDSGHVDGDARAERQKTLRKLSGSVLAGASREASLASSSSRVQPATIFTAHKTHHLFGAPAPHASTHHVAPHHPSSHPPSHPSSTHYHARKSAPPAPSLKLRNIFSNDEGEWIDETDELSGYGGGLGQASTRVSSSRPSSLSPTGNNFAFPPSVPRSPALSSEGESRFGTRYAGVVDGDARRGGAARGPQFRGVVIEEEEEE